LGHMTCKNIVPEWPILCRVKPYSTQLNSYMAFNFFAVRRWFSSTLATVHCACAVSTTLQLPT